MQLVQQVLTKNIKDGHKTKGQKRENILIDPRNNKPQQMFSSHVSCMSLSGCGLLYTSSLHLSIGDQEHNTVPLAIKQSHTPTLCDSSG